MQLLDTIPGMGPRTAEAVAAYLDNAQRFETGKQVSAYAGLVPKQFQSGETDRRGRITRRGPALRRMMVELAWAWLRWQPGSALTHWYEQRFAYHGKRVRKVGIVALARKLLIALWRYLDRGEIPPGARLTSWRAKVNAKASGKAA